MENFSLVVICPRLIVHACVQCDAYPFLYICFKVVTKKENVFYFLVSGKCIFPGLSMYHICVNLQRKSIIIIAYDCA